MTWRHRRRLRRRRRRAGRTSPTGRRRPSTASTLSVAPGGTLGRARSQRGRQDHPHPGHDHLDATGPRPRASSTASTPSSTPHEVRRRIGVTGQYAGLDDFLTTAGEPASSSVASAGLRRHGPTAERGISSSRFELARHRRAPRRASCRAGHGAGSILPPAWSPHRPSCSSTSPPPGSTPPPARRCGRWSPSSPPPAPRSCSPPNTSKRPTGSPTTWSSCDHGRIAAHGTPAQLKSPDRRQDRPGHHPRAPPRPRCRQPTRCDRTRRARTRARLVHAGRRRHGRPTSSPRSPPRSDEMTDLDITSPSLDDVFFHLATTGAQT